jgi:acetolactate synthase-1/2/3 large subunit
MNGAEVLLETSRQLGIEVCFANPGTTEMPLVAALDRVGLRAVLGLFEGVCTGAADGYARMAERPAATLLHLGPGFANGLANLHNARRAGSPVVNWIGDQATWHLSADAPLTSDIRALAGTVGWVRSAVSAAGLAQDGADALAAALGPPSGVASLIIPVDAQWNEAPQPHSKHGAAVRAASRRRAEIIGSADALEGALRALRGPVCGLLLGGRALRGPALHAAARIQAHTGCRVWTETFAARHERGAGLPDFPRLPYFPEQARATLSGVEELVLVGTRNPVAFFAYPNQPSRLAPEPCTITTLCGAHDEAAASLEALAHELGAPHEVALEERPRVAPASGPLDVGALGRTLAALQPEGAIVVDEAATSGLAWAAHAAAAPPHTVLALTGGAIGQGLPCAVGAAIARPGQRVIAFQADGSGLYTLQALWTMAREALDVTVVICANRLYRILQVELARAGIAEPGPAAHRLTQLGPPPIDWVAAARAFGVPGTSVRSAEELAQALRSSFAAAGPSLIEAVLAG